MRKKHSAEEKTRMVLEVIRGEETLNEIAARNNIHPNLLTRWKTQAVKGMPQLFEKDTIKTRQQTKEHQQEKDELYKQIGMLTTQVEWLKKKSTGLHL